MIKTLLSTITVAAALCASTQAVAQTAALGTPVKINGIPTSAAPKTQNPDEVLFSYAPNGTYYITGTEVSETYDLAILIDQPQYIGKQVLGVIFDFADVTSVSNVSGWTSTDLLLNNNGTNAPTGESVTLSSLTQMDNEIRFTNPVTIPEEGLYVGYSFTHTFSSSASAQANYPICIGTNKAANSFFFHTSSSNPQWQDSSVRQNALSMRVILSGVQTGGVELKGDYVIVEPGKAYSCVVTATNQTGVEVKSLEYSYEVAGFSGELSANCSIGMTLGASAYLTLNMPAIETAGSYELLLTPITVNGSINANDGTSGITIPVIVTSSGTGITHRAVMEEYTGTWCGWCPRGFVAMARMNESHPDDFIGLAFHYQDPMQAAYAPMPQSPSGFPSCFLDRSNNELDPYHGSAGAGYRIEQNWLDACNIATPASVELAAGLSDDKQTVYVSTDVSFIFNTDNGNYSIAYALVADDITGTDEELEPYLRNIYGDEYVDAYLEYYGTLPISWLQANYLRRYPSYYPDADFEIFTKGSSYVELVYDDVVILSPDITGVEGSIPATITADQTINHTYAFDLSQAIGFFCGQSLVQDLTKLRVVAMVLNSRGEIVNANKCAVAESSSVGNLLAPDTEAVEVARYAIDGRRLAQPEPGINIIKMSDGTARKVIVK